MNRSAGLTPQVSVIGALNVWRLASQPALTPSSRETGQSACRSFHGLFAASEGTVQGLPYALTRMILCPDCGNNGSK